MSMTSAEIIATFTNVKNDIENTIIKKGGTITGGFSTYADDFNSLFNSLLNATISGDIETDAEFLKSNIFLNCSKITSVYAPKLTKMSNAVFSSCSALSRVDAPILQTVTGTSQIFNNCTNLKKVYMPELQNTGAQKMFQFCTGLEIIYLPKVTNVAPSTFTGCTALRVAEINRAGNISSLAFENCTSLKALIIRVMDCSLLNTDAFKNTPIANGTGFIYMPDAYVENYKKQGDWSVYASQIKGVSEIPQDVLDELEAHKLDN